MWVQGRRGVYLVLICPTIIQADYRVSARDPVTSSSVDSIKVGTVLHPAASCIAWQRRIA